MPAWQKRQPRVQPALDLDGRPVVDDVDEGDDEVASAAAAGSGRCAW